MSKQTYTLSEDQYYEMMSFLISSAYLLYRGEQEVELYPSFRLMDAAQRLTAKIAANTELAEDGWPHIFMQSCEKNFDLMGIDDDAFKEFIDHTSLVLAKEMKKRIRE
jgi:hypothetical protein